MLEVLDRELILAKDQKDEKEAHANSQHEESALCARNVPVEGDSIWIWSCEGARDKGLGFW